MRMEMSSNETLESMLICTKASSQEIDNNKKLRPQDEEAQKCPRCDSCNTKFCYYNNYSLTQPRYFCKSCKRYWTKGGTLRNVPVGGGCRKNNKRSSSSSSSDSPASSKIRTIDQYHDHSQRPLIMASSHNHSLLPYESTDLSLALSRLHNGQLRSHHDHHNHISVLGNFLETPPIGNCLQNVFYGEDHHYENVGNMIYEGLGNLPYDDLMRGGSGPSGGSGATTHVEQEGRAEGCHASGCATEEDGDGGIMMGGVDAIGGQSSWINGFGSSNWPGFLNSRLM